MLGIIILNYNTYLDVFTCVKSIINTTNMDYRIYIVDNASLDDSYNKLCEKYKTSSYITVLKSEKNNGYSCGNNIGIYEALRQKCDLICVINPDVTIKNNALDIMCETITAKKNSDVAVVGPSIEAPGVKEAQFARRKYTFKDFVLLKKPLYYLKVLANLSQREIRQNKFCQNFKFKGMVSGCCFVIKGKVFRQIGLFDERVFLFGEEDIIAYKLDKKEYYTMIAEKAKVYHNANNSTKSRGTAFITYNLWISSAIVLRAYCGINNIKLLYVTLFNTIGWLLRCVLYSDYRQLAGRFIKESIRVFNIKTGVGLRKIV